MADFTYSPEQIPDHIDACVLSNDFRPTVTVLAASDDLDPQFILVKSIWEDRDIWWPVQGGLEGKTPQMTTADELEIEVDLVVDHGSVEILGGIDYPTRLREGFTRGKFMIACSVEFSSMRARLNPNTDEVSDLRTVNRAKFSEIMTWNKVKTPDSSIKANFLLNAVSAL